MKYNGLTRRMFLQGAGNLLITIPLLESLMPQAFAQTGSPLCRYIQLISPFGINPGDFWGQGSYETMMKGTNSLANNIVSGGNPTLMSDLASFGSTTLSKAIGPELSALRSKFSIVRGFDVLTNPANPTQFHNMIYPTSASTGKIVDNADYIAPPFTNQQTVDMVIANASGTYPAGFPNGRKAIVFGPKNLDVYFNSRSFSWARQADGSLQTVPPINETASLYNVFMSEFTNIGGGATAPNPRPGNLMSAIFEDYKRVRDGTKISSADRLKLESYMSLVSDIQRGFTSPSTTTGGSSCQDPRASVNMDPNLSPELQFEQQARILAAALACNMTRVASVMLVFDRNGAHEGHHSQYDDGWYVPNFIRFSRHVAFLMKALEQIPDGATNLLDNSIIYWASEYGARSWWGQHVTEDYTVLVAGGGGGNLNQGKFMDFRKQPSDTTRMWWTADETGSPGGSPLLGLPLNNLLVTFMNCMGLRSTDYETVPGGGYGFYPQARNLANLTPDPNFWLSTAGRRSPIPNFYKGPILG